MASPFCLSMGYNFGCMIASDTLFASRGGFSGSSYLMKTYLISRFSGMLPWQPFLAFYIWGAYWRHLKNTTEPSMCGSNMALCQITLTTRYYGRPMHYIFALWFLCIFFFFYSSPNLSGRRLDVYHTATHGVALVRI